MVLLFSASLAHSITHTRTQVARRSLVSCMSSALLMSMIRWLTPPSKITFRHMYELRPDLFYQSEQRLDGPLPRLPSSKANSNSLLLNSQDVDFPRTDGRP